MAIKINFTMTGDDLLAELFNELDDGSVSPVRRSHYIEIAKRIINEKLDAASK